jgi:hypothetical protein
MAKQTIEQIRAELDALNEKMAKKRNVSDTLLIAKADPIYRKKLSKSLKGKEKTQEHIKNHRNSMRDVSGENNSFFGKTHTVETKRKISLKKKGKEPSNKGTNHTQDALEKMRKPRSTEGKANMRGPREKKTCPHCGFIGAGGNMGRYHFDNCKHK